MKNNFKRCLALILAIMTIVGSFAIPVSAAEHEHTWEMKDKKEPTCATQGYESWFCAGCQKYEVRNITSRLDHEYVFVVAEKLPTCSVDGHPANAYVCKNGCGNYYLVEGKEPTAAEKAQWAKKPALPDAATFDPANELYHKWGAPVIDSKACESKDYVATYTCEFCNGEVPVEMHDGIGYHKFGDPVVTKAPTCGANGEAKRTCETCNYSEKLVIEKVTTGHTYRKDKDGNIEVKYVYSAQSDASKKPKHTKQQYCTLCAKWIDIVKNQECSFTGGMNGLGWVLDGEPSTCSYRATYKRTCDVCGNSQTRKDVQQKFHDYSLNVYVEEKGKHTLTERVHAYKQYTCTTCGEDFKIYEGHAAGVARENIPVADWAAKDNYLAGDTRRWVPVNLNDHTWANTSFKVDPTCTASGLQGQYCIDLLDDGTPCTATHNKVLAAAHSLNSNKKEFWVEPTCTTDGYYYQKCVRCDYIKKGDTIKKIANGHAKSSNWVEAGTKLGDVAKAYNTAHKNVPGFKNVIADDILAMQIEAGYVAPTCFEKGKTFKVCPNCNTRMNDITDKAALNHSSSHWDGSAFGIYYGTGCFDDRYYEIKCQAPGCGQVKKVVVIPAAGSHDFTGELIELQEATCYTKGLMGYECARSIYGCESLIATKELDYAQDYHPNADKQVASGSVAGNLYNGTPTWPVTPEFSCVETRYEWIYCQDCHRNYRRPIELNNTVGAITAKVNAVAAEVNKTITSIYYNGKVIPLSALTDTTIKSISGTHTKVYAVYAAPSCDKLGDGVEICLQCDYKLLDAKVPMIAHTKTGTMINVDGGAVVTGASCAGDINWKMQCTTCNGWIWSGVLKAEPHNFVKVAGVELAPWEWVKDEDTGLDIVATCKSDAEQRQYCVNGCGFYNSKTVSKSTVAHTEGDLVEAFKDSDCLNAGVYKHVKCSVCDALCYVDHNNKNKLVVTTTIKPIAAKGHLAYDKAKGVGAKVDPDCTTFGYTEITCDRANCPGVSNNNSSAAVVGYEGYVAPTGHKIDDTLPRVKVEATCSTWEYTYLPCANLCGAKLEIENNYEVSKKMHVNKNGDILTGSCLLVLHDVECIECDGKIVGCSICEPLYTCVNAITWDKDGKPENYCQHLMPDGTYDATKINPILPTHNYSEEKFSACNVVKKTCTVCGDIAWESGAKVYHKFVVKSEPSIKTEGIEVCEVCGYENPNKIPKLPAVVFDLKAYNPLDPDGSIVNGGKVYVKITMKAVETIDVNAIRVALKYNTDDLIFVGAVDNTSVFGEFAQANAKKGIAYVFDDAGKERFNVEIEGEKEIEYTTLEFYVKPNAFDESDRRSSIVSFASDEELAVAEGKTDVKDIEWPSSVLYYDVEASTEKEDVYSDYAFDITTNNRIDLKIDQLGDYSNNGKINATDLAVVRDRMIDIINKVEGAEYDAVLDIDHNGVIDMNDYGYIKQFMVRKYEHWQFGDILSYNEWLAELAADKDNKIEPDDDVEYIKWLEDVKPN